MQKQGNQNSHLLDQLLKTAANAKPQIRKDFIHQIIPIIDGTKTKTLREIFAQFSDPAESPAPAMDEPLDAGSPDAAEEPMDLPVDEPGMDEPDMKPEDPQALISQALELLQKAQAAMGKDEVADDLDIAEHEAPVDEAVGTADDMPPTDAAPIEPAPLLAHKIIANGTAR